jgi:hypothetical protein
VFRSFFHRQPGTNPSLNKRGLHCLSVLLTDQMDAAKPRPQRCRTVGDSGHQARFGRQTTADCVRLRRAVIDNLTALTRNNFLPIAKPACSCCATAERDANVLEGDHAYRGPAGAKSFPRRVALRFDRDARARTLRGEHAVGRRLSWPKHCLPPSQAPGSKA